MARRVGVTRQYVRRLELGERRPSVSVARCLVEVLDLGGEDAGEVVGHATGEHGRDFPARSDASSPDVVDVLQARRVARVAEASRW